METYSITTDFGGVTPNIKQLHEEINENVVITTPFQGINNTGDVVDVIFDSTISAPEKTELDTLVANHVPVFTPDLPYKMTIFPRKNSYSNKSYKRMGTDMFLGGTYAKSKIISHMDSGATSYNILIFNKDTQDILLETTLSNTTEESIDLGVLSNVPTGPSQLEISVKKNGGGGKIYVESVTICYAN